MNLPTTRRGCIDLYEKRRESHTKKTKLDMYLGGMICASDDEFERRKPMNVTSVPNGAPCLCKSYPCPGKATATCLIETDKTMKKLWDGDLYDEQ